MKNYSLNIEDLKELNIYVLKFEKKKDKIIVYYADGSKDIIANTKNNYNKLIDKMERQARNSNVTELETILKTRIDKYKKYLVVIAFIFAMTLGTSICLGIDKILGIIGSIVIASGLSLTKKISNDKSLKNDIEKSKFLLDNAELLNNNISKDNVLSLVSSKTINIIKNTDKDYKVFDINSINNMSLDDLKQIRENISRIQYFNFDENKNLSEEKSLSKKLIKTK